MYTHFIDIYYQLGPEKYFVFFNWLRGKLWFLGVKLTPKKGCCKTWVEKWNRRCNREGYYDMVIHIGVQAPESFIKDPLGVYDGSIDLEE